MWNSISKHFLFISILLFFLFKRRKRPVIHYCEPTFIYFLFLFTIIDFDSFEGFGVPMYNTYGSYNCTCFMLASTRNVKCHGQPGASCSMQCSSLCVFLPFPLIWNFIYPRSVLPLSERKSSQLLHFTYFIQ